MLSHLSDHGAGWRGFSAWAALVMIAALALAASAAEEGQARAPDANAETEAARQRRTRVLWAQHWRTYARKYARVGQQYFTCQTYDPRFPSSKRQTVAEYQKVNTWIMSRQSGMVIRKTSVTPPQVEAELATMLLPELAVGQYGFIRSCMVGRILSSEAMLVSNIKYLESTDFWRERQADRAQLSKKLGWQEIEQELREMYKVREEVAKRQREMEWRYHLLLLGFPTRDLVSGATFSGPDSRRPGMQIAIVGVYADEGYYWSSGNHGQVRHYLAVPAEVFKKGLTEEQFKDLLKERGLSPETFADLVTEKIRENPRNVEQLVFNALEDALPESQRVRKITFYVDRPQGDGPPAGSSTSPASP